MPVCSKCGQSAIVRLSYNATDYCEGCFCELFESRVRQANKDFGMFRLNQRTAVGVSGGKDSAAMLYVLSKKIVPGVHGAVLLPLLIDEGIQGYRNLAAEKAQQLCGELGLELTIRRYSEKFLLMDDVMKRRDAKQAEDAQFKGKRSCSYCGVFRKSMLNQAALDLQADALAIGHNADDVAQTFLMNFMHHDASAGARLAPSQQTALDAPTPRKAGFVPRIKPLLYNLEKECALYCEIKGLPYYRGNCPYADESFRGDVKNSLNELEAKQPGVKFNLVRSYLDLHAQLERLPSSSKTEERVLGKLRTCSRCGQNSSQALCQACQLVAELS